VAGKTPSPTRTLEQVLAEINKKYGQNTILKASESRVTSMVPRLSTGVYGLDYATGGGVPVGRFTMIKGDEGTGKSSLAMRVVKSAQRTCRFCYAVAQPGRKHGGKGEFTWIWEHAEGCEALDPSSEEDPSFRIVYVDVEGTFLNQWARAIGVDLARMHLTQPEWAEQAVDIIQTMIMDGVVDLVVLDSVASMAPTEELEKSCEEDVVGTGGKLMNRAFRDWGAAMNKMGRETGRKPTVIFINQIRYKIGVMFGNPETVPGGKAQLFAPSVVIRLRPRPPVLAGKGATAKPLRWNTKYKVEKNKVGVAHYQGEYEVAVVNHEEFIQGDVTDYKTVLAAAKECGVLVQEKKKWIYTDSDLSGGPYRVQDDVVEAWIEDLILYEKVKAVVLRESLRALA